MSCGIPSQWADKKKEVGNNVCVCGHKLQSELHVTTTEGIIEWVGKKCCPEMTLVKMGIGLNKCLVKMNGGCIDEFEEV